MPTNNNEKTVRNQIMSKHKDGAAVTLTHHQQLQPRLRKTTVRAPAVDQEQVQEAAAFQMPQLRNKRKATDSPNKMMDKMVKRSALGNVTNAGPNAGATVAKKTVLQQIDNLKIENSSSKIAKVSRITNEAKPTGMKLTVLLINFPRTKRL